MRVVLCGAGGMLAHDIRAAAPPGVEVIPKTHAQLDVTDADAMACVVEDTAPHVIINCSGYTNVDAAESEPAAAFLANGTAPGIIGAATARARDGRPRAVRCTVVHFSTDYVFDGMASRPYREGDPPGPINVYGTSKLAGERALAASGADYLLLRTSWLFGAHGRSFPRTMWQRATEGKQTKVVDDQRGRLTYTVDLARATWSLIMRHRGGGADGDRPGGEPRAGMVLHLANAGEATWYRIAQRIFEAVGAVDLLTPCTTPDYPTPAKRPAYSVLDTTRAEILVGGPLPPWEDAVDRFLTELARA